MKPVANTFGFMSGPLPARFLVTRQHIIGAFPWREKIEVAEFLGEPNRFVDDALELVVVAHLDEAGQREILAQRVTLEAIIGEAPPQIRMASEHNPIEVVSLPFIPI